MKWNRESFIVQDIQPVIKPDKNAIDNTDNDVRNKYAKERKRSYKKWARKHKYGMRWPATEGIFSAIKRIFGEHSMQQAKLA